MNVTLMAEAVNALPVAIAAGFVLGMVLTVLGAWGGR